jgi:hypothetical protein
MKKCMPWRSVLLIAALLASSPTQAYQPELHQQLTFLSAKQVSRCLPYWQEADASMAINPLSTLDMRYVVRANAARAKGSFFGRMFRWNYLDISQNDSDAVWGMFDTRFNSRFHDLTDQLVVESQQRQRLEALGSLLSHIQDVSTPSRVVPVYTGRWWSFSLQDRFDRYPVDVQRLEAAGQSLCQSVLVQVQDIAGADVGEALSQLLFYSARQTIIAVSSEINGMPAEWTAFWQPASNDGSGNAFGEYGVAGNNFGDRVEFRCGDTGQEALRCILLEDDPLYQDFAFARHLSAVEATMVAMLIVQYRDIL